MSPYDVASPFDVLSPFVSVCRRYEETTAETKPERLTPAKFAYPHVIGEIFNRNDNKNNVTR